MKTEGLLANTEIIQANSDSISRHASVAKGIAAYAELQKQLHHDLRAQKPDWVDAEGNSPMCDWYDRRLAKLIWTVHAIRA
jgi:hypothetical protein